MNDSVLLIELLEEVLDKHHAHYPHKKQISFDCPVCSQLKGIDKGDGKGNLEINYGLGVYKCWACSETNYTHGSLNKLFNKWANRRQKETWKLIGDEFIPEEKREYEEVELPKEYISFDKGNKLTIPYKEAYNYLRKRGITDEIISKYSIGYTTEGKYRGRIIIPSFDENGEVNYFVGRSYVNHKMKYKNPEAEKDKIIFNEHLIRWDKDIHLVEGVFDMFFIDNSIPVLGKNLSDTLWSLLYEKATKDIIICLDGDAWTDAKKLYRKLDGGRLTGRVRLIKLPKDKDVAEMGGISGIEKLTLL